jgi:hypothetical protein
MPDYKDEKPLPSIDLGDIKLITGVLKMHLEKSRPVKEGDSPSKYGGTKKWYLWIGRVENAKAYEGRGKDKKPLPLPYTGKVIFFPTDRTNDELIALCKGNKDVDINIRKVPLEKNSKIYKIYELEKLSEGTPDTSGDTLDITPTEAKFLNDCLAMVKSGYNITEDLFIRASQEPQYGGAITLDKAKILYVLLKSG